MLSGTLSAVGTLSGVLSSSGSLSGSLTAAAGLTGVLTGSGTLSGSLAGVGTLAGTLTVPATVGGDEYTGSYEFTPTTETQTISIQYKIATQNITINPIPSNYGLITWDGATLTVS